MPAVLFVLMAGATGFIAGIVQSRLFASAPGTVKPFSEHMEDVRAHVRAACIVMSAILLLAIFYDARIEFVQRTAGALTLSWMTGVALACRVFLSREFDSA